MKDLETKIKEEYKANSNLIDHFRKAIESQGTKAVKGHCKIYNVIQHSAVFQILYFCLVEYQRAEEEEEERAKEAENEELEHKETDNRLRVSIIFNI